MEVHRKVLRIYQRENGDLPFVQWMKGLRDIRGKQAIEARLARVRLGNLGDHRLVVMVSLSSGSLLVPATVSTSASKVIPL